ncbi:MAG: DNA repair protein RecO [Planctomycetes bacterium]|nr:DNA repair protein RecO [Planctomycetota bacterium]
MAYCKSEAIVLRRFDYSETSQIAWVYTREYGKEKLIAKGAKRLTKNALGALDPLTHIHVVYLDRQREGLRTLTEWDLLDSFYGLREDLDRLYLASYAVQLVSDLTEDGEANPRVFEILLRVLKRLCQEGDHRKLVFAFELALLRSVGFLPRLVRCAHCGCDLAAGGRRYFSIREGGALCEECGGVDTEASPVSPAMLPVMSVLAHGDRAQVDRLVLPPEVGVEMRRVMNMHLSALLGREPKLTKHLNFEMRKIS